MFAKHSVFKISLYSLTLIITLGSILFLYASIVSIITHNPKTLEQLDQQIGMVQNYNFNFKNSRGNLYLKTRNSDIIKYTIRTDDKEIYKKLKFKKVKIYSNSDIFSNYIQQIEDENKTIYKKYNYKAEQDSINIDINIIKTAIFCILFSIFLIFITNLKGPKPKNFRKG